LNKKLAIIIPTYNRHEILRRLLSNLNRVGPCVDELIIVDASKEDLFLKENIEFSKKYKYFKSDIPSLTYQRNLGLENISKDINLICFLDDDVEILTDSFKIMFNFWENVSEYIGGAAFNIIEGEKARRFWMFKQMFLMGDNQPGNVLISGYQTMMNNIRENIYTKWLPGGVTVWRKKIFNEFKYDESLKGYGFIEDLDFSYRVGKKYRLICIADARVKHEPHQMGKLNAKIFGYYQIINRFYFVTKHKEFSRFLFLWASFGQIIENCLYGLTRKKKFSIKIIIGNIQGLKQVLKKIFSHESR